MQYIGLLRGINVGGQRKVPMAELRACLTDVGFANVQTYINSGNVWFDAPEQPVLAIIRTCEESLRDRFGFEIKLAVLTVNDYHAVLAQAPSWWDQIATSKHNLIVAIPPMTGLGLAEAVGQAKSDYEQIAVVGQVVFWSAPLETFGRTRWSTVTKKAIYQCLTIRNANTAKRLEALTMQ